LFPVLRNCDCLEAVTFALVEELYQHGGKIHKTSVGIHIGKELEKEYTEIERQISVNKLQKKNLSQVINDRRERKQKAAILKRGIKGLERDLKSFGEFKKWWAGN
jgi:DNA-binding transcriptional ArsR family regulator